MKIYGEELRKSILDRKERNIAAMNRRAERIENWETDEEDCFMSQRVEENAVHECNMQLNILDGDGMMDFDAIFDGNGEEVCVRCVNTKYGVAYVGRGIFASSIKALLKKTGWTPKTIRVPVWTKFCAAGSGLYGVYCGSYERVRWHTNMKTGEYVGYPD